MAKERKKKKLPDEFAARLGTVDPEKEAEQAQEELLRKMVDPVEIMSQNRRVGIEARALHKTNWDTNWRLYNNDYDFSLKADWQSKNFVASVPEIVRGIKYVLKSSLVSASDFFTVEFPAIPKDSEYKEQLNTWGKGIIQNELKKNKFVNLIGESIVLGLLESLIHIKVMPNGRKGVKISNESAYNVILDPTGRKRWLIHSITKDFDQVLEQSDSIDKATGKPKNGKMYDRAEVEKAIEEFTRQPEASAAAGRMGQQTQPTISAPFRKECVIDEHHGDLIGGNGKLIMRMCSFTVLNEKYLIRKPFSLSVMEHGQIPIITGAINPKPKSVYHQALVSDISGLANVATELLNITLDSNMMSMAKAFELDLGAAADPDDFRGGITPGKTFKKKANLPPGTKLLTPIEISGPTQQDMMIFENVLNKIQKSVGFYNEFAQSSLGNPKGGRATAREVHEQSSSNSQSMKALAEEMEETLVTPMLTMIWSNLIQYFRDFEQLDGILPREVIDYLTLQKEGLKALFGDAAKFDAKGMSGVLARLEMLSKIQQFGGLISEFPELKMFLKAPEILEQMLYAFGFDRKVWMIANDEIVKMKNQAKLPVPAPVPGMPPGGLPVQ